MCVSQSSKNLITESRAEEKGTCPYCASKVAMRKKNKRAPSIF